MLSQIQFEYMHLSLFGRFAMEPISGVTLCLEELEIGAESENKFMTRITVFSPTNKSISIYIKVDSDLY